MFVGCFVVSGHSTLLHSLDFFLFLFFFSSRRRHTRSLCDWSSDVCSSDLTSGTGAGSVWAVVGTSSHSAPNAAFANDVATVSTQYLTLPTLTATGPVTLDFWRSITKIGRASCRERV